MLYLFLSLFVSHLLLVTPFVIEQKQVENREEPPSLPVNKTISESPDPKTTEAPWTNVEFPLEEAENDFGTCRKVGMYVSFAELGLSNEIIAPDGFNAYQCKGKCSSTQQKKFPNRSAIMALLEKKKGIEGDDEACCVPTKLSPISVIVYERNGHIVLRKFDDMVVEECGCGRSPRI
ncbi:embryonic growth/differentiation factor 1-like [Orbicella faveolata]|uniref:embryonic growth/differentiation factor 1-like n=1 Tax=Orbicella faveolata TaxID=48498 RepID=UPI0009E2BC72|nr:embryonic growth/differentiation factor 1-like [Orbicella faveolata]